MIDTLTLESFTAHIGSDFVATVGEHSDRLTLIEATGLAREGAAGMRQPFALLFHGNRPELMIHSQTLEFSHPEMGSFALMISPVGRNEDGNFQYEAIFN